MARTGHIYSKDATLQHHTKLRVRQLDDGTIEYHVGDSAGRRDGWATMPADLVSSVTWDKPESDLVLCLSSTGWSLHAPGASDEDIREGDAPPLASGDGRPTAGDYQAAAEKLAQRTRR